MFKTMLNHMLNASGMKMYQNYAEEGEIRSTISFHIGRVLFYAQIKDDTLGNCELVHAEVGTVTRSFLSII